MKRILALDSALARCSVAIVLNDSIAAMRQQHGERGQATFLPLMAAAVFREAAIEPATLDFVAVTIGPGSFTGIRAALAFAHGIALGAGLPVVGVSVGEALAEALPHLGHRALWSAIDTRRGRVFLERGDTVQAFELGNLPAPDRPLAIAGDAAVEVAATLAARDFDVMLTDARFPQPRHVAIAALRRHRSEPSPRPAQPLYVDPPEARLPAARRPPPSA
jgi:tRNA threonylcarbamoyladenosine biosynthesis protein TsaB